MNDGTIRVTVWNEYRHERAEAACRAIYPEGIHGAIRALLCEDGGTPRLSVSVAVLDDPAQGLPDALLENTDVLIWWGHLAHDEVADALVERIYDRVCRGGMGLILLHSAHQSKVFRRIVGMSGELSCGPDQHEIMWTLLPGHPIAAGVPDHFSLFEELYCEPFYIPRPDELVFGGWFERGYLFRAGLCYHRGAGRVFYFQPGHEYCRSFENVHVRRILCNAVRWAASDGVGYAVPNGCVWRPEDLRENCE